MAKIMYRDNGYLGYEPTMELAAEKLYKAGYRKTSEVIDEFVERLKAKESPKLLEWEYGEGYLDCIKTAEKLADEMRKQEEK